MRVFFDASVIIAAILSRKGGSALLFEYIKKGRIIGISSQTAIGEILDKEEKLKRTRKELEDFISTSGLVIREIITTEEIEPYKDLVDIDDAHLIAGAILTKCSYLVTLDKKYLLRRGVKERFLPLQIVVPKELLIEIVSVSREG